MGAARICSPEVTRKETLKLAPALALAGPSHRSCAGAVLPGIELSEEEAPGVGTGISFATAEGGAEAAAEAGVLACGGPGPAGGAPVLGGPDLHGLCGGGAKGTAESHRGRVPA